MEASKAEAGGRSSVQSTNSGSSSVQEVTPPAPTRPGSAFLLDRAQMERERLERQKRLRPDIADPSTSKRSRDVGGDEEDDQEDASAKRQRVSSSLCALRTNVHSSSRTASPVPGSSKSSRTANTQSGESLFFEGELRQTANKHVDAAKDTRPVFRLTDILAPVRTFSLRQPVYLMCTERRDSVRNYIGLCSQSPVDLLPLQPRDSGRGCDTRPCRCVLLKR